MPALPHNAVPHYASWVENEQTQSALWCTENHSPLPKRIVVVDDTLTADSAFLLANQGTSMLWRGDFQNAKQLLNALARRVDKKKKRKAILPPDKAFNLHRLTQSQRARLLNMILIQVNPDFVISLRRAPDVKAACEAVFEPRHEPFLLSLRALQGIIGSFEWRKKGVVIPALAQSIHVHYGVFSPIRGEYIDLVAHAPLPATDVAFDIGTGSGVLAAVLAHRGAPDQVPIRLWARVTDDVEISELDQLAALDDLHCWSSDYAAERLRWKPRHPLHVLALRVYRLPVTQLVPFRPEYGGCSSWVSLAEPIALQGAEAVLSDHQYAERLEAVKRALAGVTEGSLSV
jgi:hypothetical protein